MKCEKCNQEATFFYNSFVNGRLSHHHYCADCAREEGYAGALDFQPTEALNETGKLFPAFPALPEFPEPLADRIPLFDLFAPARSMMRAFDSFSESFGGMLKAAMPSLRIGWSAGPLMLGEEETVNEPETVEAPETEAVVVEPETVEEA